jgi:hypothetical protein
MLLRQNYTKRYDFLDLFKRHFEAYLRGDVFPIPEAEDE